MWFLFFSLKYQPKHTHKLCSPSESSNPSVDNQEHEKDLKRCSANDDMKTRSAQALLHKEQRRAQSSNNRLHNRRQDVKL